MHKPGRPTRRQLVAAVAGAALVPVVREWERAVPAWVKAEVDMGVKLD